MRLLCIFAGLAVAYAQAPSGPAKSVIGEVTSIDAAAKQIKMKSDAGPAFTVSVDDATSYVRVPPGENDVKKGTKIAFTDVAVGDRMLARGPVADDAKLVAAKTVVIITKADMAKKHDRDRAEWTTRGIAGTVKSLNPTAKEITVDTHVRDGQPVVIEAGAAQVRHYAPDSTNFADAKPIQFGEVQPGDTIRALGDKSEDGARFKAEELLVGSFQTIAATVISVDAASGEVKVTDLVTKKPVTVKTNSGSMLRHLEERTATMLARRMRPDLAAAGGPGGGRGPGGGAPGGGGGIRLPDASQQPAGGAPAGAGGPGAGGGRGPGGRGPAGGDLSQILERSPQLSLADLKKGDALIISSARATDGAAITAFTLIAGVEPFLAAAPRTAGQVDLGSWNLSVGSPEQ